jgi:RNA polymerase sigma factor (sigma-70 family)
MTRPRTSDERLVAAFRAGDDGAFRELHERYRPALVRFAKRVLRDPDGALAEDVVQEALWRAHRALRRDARPMQLRPWLYRLVRNCCLDEIGRVRVEVVELGSHESDPRLVAPAHEEPPAAYERRADLRQLLDDVALLPTAQRHALIRRELDGLTHEQLAAELQVTPGAARSLVHRARTGLTKLVEARSATCRDVQSELLVAHDARHRASAHAYRHLAKCAECRTFRSSLQEGRRALAVLAPGPALLLVLGGAGAKFGLAGKAGAAKVAAATTAATLAVGAAGVALPTLMPGDPAPVRVDSRALPGGVVLRHASLPAGVAVVRRALDLRAGVRRHPTIALRCPGGTRVADLLPLGGARISVTYAPGTVVGVSRLARVIFEARQLSRDVHVTVAVLCKRPDHRGSIVAGPTTGHAAVAGEAGLVVGPSFAYLRPRPSPLGVVGSVRVGQPVTALSYARKAKWVRVVTDTAERGWLPAEVLTRRTR